MVERLVRNEEASGSNPLISTKNKDTPYGVFFVLVDKCSPKRCIRSGSRERAKTKMLIFFTRLVANEALLPLVIIFRLFQAKNKTGFMPVFRFVI